MALMSNFILFIFFQLATAQFLDDANRATTETPNRREPNPDSPFLDKLGNLLLDFDEAFSRYASPQGNSGESVKEPLYDKSQSSRSNYFGRIRENYSDLQKRVGSALGINGDVSIFSDFLGVNVRNRDDGPLVDVSLPFLPMKLTVKPNSVKTDDRAGSTTATSDDSIPVTSRPRLPEFESNLQLGNMNIDVGSRTSEGVPLVRVNVDQPSEQARSSRRRVINENQVRNVPDLKPSRGQNYDDSEDFSQRKGNEFESTESFQAEDSGISGRILGDVLYSESTFDKIMKRVIKDSMWLLDSDLSPSKAFQRLNRFAQKVIRPLEQSEDKDISQKRSDRKEQSFTTEDDKNEHGMGVTDETPLKRNKSPKPLHYEVDNKPDTIKLDIVSQSDSKTTIREEENILLAFTPEGVPLKLKIPDAETDNPLGFLHETLKAADVALNIPVNSYGDLEASGREILQLGAGNRGMMARALFVDLSDSQQLKSLLKTLRKFKSSSI